MNRRTIATDEADTMRSIWFKRPQRALLSLFGHQIRRIYERVISRAYECGVIDSQQLHELVALGKRMLERGR